MIMIIITIPLIARCPHCHAFVTQVPGDHRRNTCGCHRDAQENLLKMNKDKSASLTHAFIFLYVVKNGRRPRPFDKNHDQAAGGQGQGNPGAGQGAAGQAAGGQGQGDAGSRQPSNGGTDQANLGRGGPSRRRR